MRALERKDVPIPATLEALRKIDQLADLVIRWRRIASKDRSATWSPRDVIRQSHPIDYRVLPFSADIALFEGLKNTSSAWETMH